MNGYNFTNGVRRSLAAAREESARLRHEYVGTEHILLGLLRHTDTVAASVLLGLNVNLDALADVVDAAVTKGRSLQPTGPDLPYTSRAKKVIEEAMYEARERDTAWVGTEHLLLGVLREQKGIAAQVLIDRGLTYEVVGKRTTELLAAGAVDDPDLPAAGALPGRPRPGVRTAQFLTDMMRSPEVLAVFTAHQIDVPRLLEDLSQARPE